MRKGPHACEGSCLDCASQAVPSKPLTRHRHTQQLRHFFSLTTFSISMTIKCLSTGRKLTSLATRFFMSKLRLPKRGRAEFPDGQKVPIYPSLSTFEASFLHLTRPSPNFLPHIRSSRAISHGFMLRFEGQLFEVVS